MDDNVDPNKQFAAERSHKDRQEQVEYGKALFQILIGSNGLAATALLTLAGAFKQPGLLVAIAFPTLIFLAGVYFGTQGLTELFVSKGGWGYTWQLRFYGERPEAEQRAREEGWKRDEHAVRWARKAALAFAFGVLVAMVAFCGWFWWLREFAQPPLFD
jgi:hypothetical protein